MNWSPSNFPYMLGGTGAPGNRNRNLMTSIRQFQSQQQQQRQQQQVQQQDEISKSLQLFAKLAAYKNNNFDGLSPSLNISDAVMQDFACNGYVADESSVQQQLGMMHLSNPYVNRMSLLTATLNPFNAGNVDKNVGNKANATYSAAATAAILNQQRLCLQNQVNLNFNSTFWGAPPAEMYQHANAVNNAAAAVAAAAAVNMDYNSNQKKLTRNRYNGSKYEKNISAKHCVFCENNNEPEAVVRSHAVRDSAGRVLCPKLRTYTCPICGSSGDNAHTIKYCPQKPIVTMEDALNAQTLRLNKPFNSK
uniref:Nanos-type domain-containing protein n=1 Tax=Glossina palpalis gambiensis TaxID=67801 RepID=A0A1B0BB88_9MUSC